MGKIFIVNAKRTPQGRFLGELKKHSALDLALKAGEAALEGIDRKKIDQVIIGNVIMAGLGMNLARQVLVKLNIPIDKPAFTVNMMCASGMQAIILAAQSIITGDAEVVLCGGTESMSNAPYLLERARGGYKLGNGVLVDTLLRDGLVDSFDNEHMGLTAERIAEKYNISRQEQDKFAFDSQQKYAKAIEKDAFKDELVELKELDKDEHPRPDTTLERLASLSPAFKNDGTVTAGNASGINDGAAMLIVCSEKAAHSNGWRPIAEISGWASAGCDPKEMGLGPIYATRKLCSKYNLNVNDFDAIELNEAFAAQSLACIKELELNPDIINQEGGAIALGHPIGASGARIVAHLAHKISRGEIKNGLATLCVGGGMGSAIFLS
ncbi:MAG: acetyl-CoA acetyltransferase [Desulfobacteraceae bacterium 4572_35.1]|nr:MAG: acetyl-CoA acetyltransferase [Desulfobacteraceae bacterium 4572_35.1]